MPRITPFLWFDGRAEEAAEFYATVFDKARIVEISRYGEGAPYPAGTAMSVIFDLDGQRFHALNAGPQFTFNEAVSFFISCDGQDEVDHYWTALTEGGEESHCGWLKDRFGLSWQVVPTRLGELLGDSDPGRAQRAMQAMLQMSKIDIAALEAAADAA
jgi:predicted 3-demethylubiquinone-9 3-methyltransferase (glyoxalase superfamily)